MLPSRPGVVRYGSLWNLTENFAVQMPAAKWPTASQRERPAPVALEGAAILQNCCYDTKNRLPSAWP